METQNDLIEGEEQIRLTVNFSRSLLGKIDELRKAWGFRSRGATVERILQELFADDTGEEPGEEETSDQAPLP